MIFKRAREQFALQGEYKLERDMDSILPEPELTQKLSKLLYSMIVTRASSVN